MPRASRNKLEPGNEGLVEIEERGTRHARQAYPREPGPYEEASAGRPSVRSSELRRLLTHIYGRRPGRPVRGASNGS